MEDETIKLENLRDSYYSAIINMQSEEEIIKILPSADYVNFFPIIQGLKKKLKESREKLLSNLMESDSSDMVEYIRDEIRLIDKKIEICEDLLNKANEIVEEELPNNKPKKIIFAKNVSGVYFENDLKSIPKEKYSDIINCLSRLESGEEETNTEKSKQLTSNSKLAGIHEIKAFQIRLFYRKLSYDCCYVIMVKTKKDNNSRLDYEGPINRNNNTRNEFREIKIKIKDVNFREKLISENQNILQNIYEKLKNEKRIQK